MQAFPVIFNHQLPVARLDNIFLAGDFCFRHLVWSEVRSKPGAHPNSWNHFLTDHIVTFAVFPLSVDKTLVRTKWLVAADAVEGVDYDLDNLTKVWTQTNAQDQRLAEGAYRGICSGGYMPGPIADEEYLVKQFLSWYSDQLTITPAY